MAGGGKALQNPDEDLDISEERAAKRVAVGHATALSGLPLQLVIQYAGRNEGIFITNVCNAWKKAYKSTFHYQMYTPCTAAMISLQRVRWIWHDWPECVAVHGGRRRGCGSGGYPRISRHICWFLGKYAAWSVLEETLLDKSLDINSASLMRGIAAGGRVQLLSDLWEHHIPIDKETLGSAVTEVALEAVRYGNLRAFAFAWSQMDKAEGLDFKEIIECGEMCAKMATEKGFIHILEYLSRTAWWSSDNSPANLGGLAAAKDQIRVLRWFADHDFPWDEDAALGSAFGDEISTIDFLFENGCPGFDKDFVSCCVKDGGPHTLRWCYDTLRVRVPDLWNADNLQEWLLLAGTFDRKFTAKFLLQHGAEWPDIGQKFGEDIEYQRDCDDYKFEKDTTTCVWSVPFLRWAMSQGCTFGSWSTATCARLVRETTWENPEDCALLKALTFAHSRRCGCACPRDKREF